MHRDRVSLVRVFPRVVALQELPGNYFGVLATYVPGMYGVCVRCWPFCVRVCVSSRRNTSTTTALGRPSCESPTNARFFRATRLRGQPALAPECMPYCMYVLV